jgi:hypothetical protein
LKDGLIFVTTFASHFLDALKTARKVFFYSATALLVLLVGLVASVFLFKDRIIRQFVAEANKHLNTPVTIAKIDISLWRDFPNLSIVCSDVYVEDSHPGKDTLLWAQRLSFSINSLEILKRNYQVRGLQIDNSRTHLLINTSGKTNYHILKETGEGSSSISFDLKNVSLTNSYVTYRDRASDQHHIFSSEKLVASIAIRDRLYLIDATGDVTTQQIGLADRSFLTGKKFQAVAAIRYDDEQKTVDIQPSALQLNASTFEVEGRYEFKEQEGNIELEAAGKDTDIQTLISLLPSAWSTQLQEYQSEGDVYFKLRLSGPVSRKSSPFVTVEFGGTNVSIFHPQYQSRVTRANLEGSFATPSLNDLSKAEIFLRNVKGELNSEPFEANFTLQNFIDPLVALDFKGSVDAASLMNFYPIPNISNLHGRLSGDFSFSGRTELLRHKATTQQVKARGSLELQNIDLDFGAQRVEIRGLSGGLQFNNNDLALSDVQGRLARSDFRLNGHFKNIITFLLFDNQPIGIEADLYARFIDLEQLFQLGYGDRQADDYGFQLSPNVHLNFNCDVQRLHYKKFRPQKVKGNLLIKNQMAVSRDISVEALGGTLTLNGILDAKNTKAIDVVSSFKLNGIHVDSLFYLFDNFGQDFIQDKHLKGEAVADVSLEMTLNEKLHLFPETLIADVSTTIRKGELNNFEPLQALSKYLDDEGLSRLRFADLRNDIHIENKTVYIPQMEIRSNVTTIQLSGTHTFDQHIDYRVVAPLRNKKKIDPDEAFGAIEQDARGQTKIFLKITGTTDNYDVSLDKAAVKQKIASDLKKEVQELKDAFRLKGKKKKKELELSDEEFDWEN